MKYKWITLTSFAFRAARCQYDKEEEEENNPQIYSSLGTSFDYSE